MIRCNRWMLLSAVLAIGMVGCGDSNETGEAPPGQTDEQAAPTPMSEPAAAVHVFLEAVRTGDDPKAAEMLTATAREKTAQRNRRIITIGLAAQFCLKGRPVFFLGPICRGSALRDDRGDLCA